MKLKKRNLIWIIIVCIISITAVALICLNPINNIQMLNEQGTENFEDNEILSNGIHLKSAEETDTGEEQEKIIECESIMQGINNIKEDNGYYTLRVKGQIDGVEEVVDYPIELLNFHEDIIYTENQKLGDTVADQRMLVVKYWGNLQINSGVSVTASTRKRGMYIHVVGKLENKGTITMTARGAIAVGQNVYLNMNKETGEYDYIPANGANGGGAVAGVEQQEIEEAMQHKEQQVEEVLEVQ